jgi:hypothetical protein
LAVSSVHNHDEITTEILWAALNVLSLGTIAYSLSARFSESLDSLVCFLSGQSVTLFRRIHNIYAGLHIKVEGK